jgi:hypothetical protein
MSTPIKGYRRLSDDEVADINAVKAKADTVGALLEQIAGKPDVDQRWIAIARPESF